MVENKSYKKLKFAIFGRSLITDHFIEELNRLGFQKPIVFLSLDKEYKRDRLLLEKLGLFGKLEELDKIKICKIYKTKDINHKKNITVLEREKCNIGISINCRDIIKKNLINFFSGNIFNIHGGRLPFEKGAAGATWKILNNIDNIVSTLHYLTEGIDDGDIVLEQKKKLNVSSVRPIDIIEITNIVSKKLITSYLKKLKRNYKFTRKIQNKKNAMYFPRLFTQVNGLIDWNWNVDEIEIFIRAFSYPYEGAWFYHRNKKIHILEAYKIKTDINFHPFSIGRVINIIDNSKFFVACKGGILEVSKLKVENRIINVKDIFFLGDCLYSEDKGNLSRQRLSTKNMYIEN